MCKIIAFTNGNKLDLIKTVNILGNELLASEPDGFGYAAQGKKGIFGEKSISKEFNSRINKRLFNPIQLINRDYETFGEYSEVDGPLILHGRTSTNKSGLINTHPMIKQGNYLIHNGVVNDHGPKYPMTTSNDSEHVIHRFLEGIDSLETHLTGYYAFANIDTNGHLHILRDSLAQLYMTYSESHDTFIFATTKDLIDFIAAELSMVIGPIDKVKDDIYCIFHGNMLAHSQEINPRGYDYYSASKAKLSLGYDLDDNDETPRYSQDWQEYRDNDSDDYWLTQEFLDAVEEVDDTCAILDGDNRSISAHEFHLLPLFLKKQCLIETNDGRYIQFLGRIA